MSTAREPDPTNHDEHEARDRLAHVLDLAGIHTSAARPARIIEGTVGVQLTIDKATAHRLADLVLKAVATTAACESQPSPEAAELRRRVERLREATLNHLARREPT
jgi:hypothetical protein